MSTIYFIVFVLFVSYITWTWNSTKEFNTFLSRISFLIIGSLFILFITWIIFMFSKIGINYPKAEMISVVRKIILLTFVPVNSFIMLPQTSNLLMRIKNDDIPKEKQQKRIKILGIVFLTLIVFECVYFKNIQTGIINYMRKQDVKEFILKPLVIVIVGPTASGKTALSIELAKKINGEIVSCDSMQIYKDMNIGSAKPTKEEMQDIKHYMIDVVSPNERFSVAEYKKQAESAIKEIIDKGKIPIVIGGTGLYADSLIYGIEYNEIELNEQYRKELENRAEIEGLEKLYNEALKIDPEAMKKISHNDKKRIIRVLEIYRSTGKTKTELETESRKNGVKYNYKVFAINMDREILYDRINRRVDIMIENGLIDEVKGILKKYDKFPTAMQGLGYKEVVEYLNGITTKEEMIEKIKQETRRYAKRQLTWFRKNKETIWLDGMNEKECNIDIILEGIN